MLNPPNELTNGHGGHDDHARASRLVPAGSRALQTTIWMGGSHTHIGEAMAETSMAGSWVIDCAGNMPPRYRDEAARWVPCVFADIDVRPLQLPRIEEIVREVVAALRGAGEQGPADLFVVCQHGMNRSGLVTGMLLKELGFSGAEAVDLIVARRPGALSNVAFRRLLLGQSVL